MEQASPLQAQEILGRISSVARQVGIRKGLQGDLIQETWLRCAEYARKNGRLIQGLSPTEIRFRCLEARRSLLPHNLLGAEIVGSASVDPILPEESGKNQNLVDELLSSHPTLRLTPLQSDLWSTCREDPDGRWKAAKARELGCSRQNVANIVGLVRKKVRDAVEISRLLEGDLLPFFQKTNSGWAPAPLRHLVWSLLRNKSGDSIPESLRGRFEAIEGPMMNLALQTLEREDLRIQRGDPLDSTRLSLAYNLLVTAFHIRPEGTLARQGLDELMAKIPARSWVLYRFVLRAGHLANPRHREAHKEWLKERILKRDEEGLHFAGYAIAYYGGTPEAETRQLLEGDGKSVPRSFSYEPVLQRLYDNIQIPRYSSSPVWMDINFLRIVLMEAHFPFDSHPLSPCGRNTLRILCQKSLHSRDPFVVESAGGFLNRCAQDRHF